LRLHLSLFGARPEERSYRFKVTQGASAQLLMFSPQQASHPLLPTTLSVLLDYTALGAAHILTGVDHLLFLLVVLVSGWRWRQVLLALTCFTLGHATTLAASLWGGIHLPAAIVEPAIAATIVAMALFDWHSRVLLARQVSAGTSSLQTSRRGADLARLALVFSCALIHGLGLASALQELGLDPTHRLTTLVGFNLGIELGQLGVAAAFASLLAGLRLLRGLAAVQMATQAASVFAMAMGAGWFVQRVLVLS
jgi:hypothetical protein